tara:strand:- start:89 stop:298 length:210 start_codon:yes stop_codon:yes gene_type:complete
VFIFSERLFILFTLKLKLDNLFILNGKVSVESLKYIIGSEPRKTLLETLDSLKAASEKAVIPNISTSSK